MPATRWFRLVFIFSMVLALVAMPKPRSAQAAPAAPTLLAEVNGPGRGRIWVGAVPANSSSKPVLVFVHGLHGKAQNWWGELVYNGTNDMYTLAYNSGYRTAFVSLDDEVDGPASTMWTNGSTLKRQLEVITRHYGVSSVNIIAHSKGGVDSNSAVIHYGAGPMVQKIITLGSPHHGSQHADKAYSWWGGWLASLLGQRDDGTYSMQTSYMSYFRSVTDSSPNYSNVRFFTSGGTGSGPWFSAEWFGWMSLPGDNDGVVTVVSSHHPKQYQRLFTADIDHDGIRKGSLVWWRIEPTARTFWRTAAKQEAAETTTLTEKAPTKSAEVSSNTILRGGQLGSGAAVETLPVEGGARGVTFALMSNSPSTQVTFVGPDGSRVPAAAPTQATTEEAFRGAYIYAAEVKAPAAGRWSVEINGAAGDAYLLTTRIDSNLNVKIKQGNASVAPGQGISLNASAANGKGQARKVQVEALLHSTAQAKETPAALPTKLQAKGNGKGSASATLAAPASEGLFQLGVTVTGTAPDGTEFERTFPLSVPVVKGQSANKGQLPAELPAGR